MKNKLLIVAAHPDDEILGCGGTAARFIREGYEAYTLILGEGITSRDEKRQRTKRQREIAHLKKQAVAANKLLGVKDVFIHDFPDNRFDTVPLLHIIKIIEKIKDNIKPDIVFTHSERDLNIDHQITHRALLTATRPLPGETVKEIYSFEVLSSTEWYFPFSFAPNVFFDISHDFEKKIEALKKYQSELRNYPHPRSIESIKLNAAHLGARIGKKYAEAFQVVRIVR